MHINSSSTPVSLFQALTGQREGRDLSIIDESSLSTVTNYGDMASFMGIGAIFSRVRVYNRIMELSSGSTRRETLIYWDALKGKLAHLSNIPGTIYSMIVLPVGVYQGVEALLSLAAKHISSASAWFSKAASKVSSHIDKITILANNPVSQFVLKFLPYLMIANGIWQTTRKRSQIKRINEFLHEQEFLTNHPEAFFEKLKRKHFELNLEEKEELFEQAVGIVQKESYQYSDLFTFNSESKEIEFNNEAFNRLRITTVNEKDDIKRTIRDQVEKVYGELEKRSLLLKSHELSMIIGPNGVQSLKDSNVFNISNPNDFQKGQLTKIAKEIVQFAKSKRTADKIDIVVQVAFVIVGVCMIIGVVGPLLTGLPFLAPVVAALVALAPIMLTAGNVIGWGVWIGQIMYVSRKMKKRDWTVEAAQEQSQTATTFPRGPSTRVAACLQQPKDPFLENLLGISPVVQLDQ